MRFQRVALHAPSEKLSDLAAFYATEFGGVRVGETDLVFEGAAGRPFYHFALLAPGNRFDAALEWAQANLELLPDRETGELVFDFENWDARAFYFHDPAGNIVELIAHRGVGETAASGGFEPSELLGISEIGLIGNGAEIANGLTAVGLELWDGALLPGRLGFVGERARTLIVAEPGRGWLPTGRAAEPHPVDVVITGIQPFEVTVGGHRIRGLG